MKHVTIIVPSYNPDEKLAEVVNGLAGAGFDDILVVNDGSKPECAARFDEVKDIPGVTVLTHEVNKGKGRAMKTAFSYVLENCPDSVGVITVDGDNQHTVKDIRSMKSRDTSISVAAILMTRRCREEAVLAIRSRRLFLPMSYGFPSPIRRPVFAELRRNSCRLSLRREENGMNSKRRCSLP